MTKGNKSGNTAPEQPTVTTPPKEVGHPAEDVICSNEEYNKDLVERLEEKYKAKLIKFEELLNIAPEFGLWLKELVRYGNVDSQVLIFWDLNSEENRIFCYFYTDDHIYHISVYKPTKKNPRGYLGCTASTRKPRVGEDWNRGNDLPDGKYCKKTFDAIVYRIVAYELKNLQLWIK